MLVAADNHLGVVSILLTVVGIAIWAESRVAWVRKVSVAAVVLVVPLMLSNFGLIPQSAPAYSFVSRYFVILAIPLLLFKADLRRIFTETGRTLFMYAVAAFGVLSGTALGYLVIPLEEFGARAPAAMASGYIGGSMNFVAVSRAVGLDADPTQFSIVLGAETALGLMYLILLATLPTFAWFQRWDRRAVPERPDTPVPGIELKADGSFSLQHFALALGLSSVICVVGISTATALNISQYDVLLITLLAVTIANLAPRQLRKMKGDAEIGMYLLYVFFAAYGAGTDLGALIANAPSLIVFGSVILAVHFAISFGAGRVLGFSAREIAIASNACVLGPTTAAALAAKDGWNELITPGVLCGVLGYAIGNFVGISVFQVLS